MYALNHDQLNRAHTAAHNALRFSDAEQALLPTAIIRHLWFDGAVHHVANALARYQTADGGFGNRLEPDIHAPESNPFAARIAMQYLRLVPDAFTADIRVGLKDWLVANQHIDGDWHFSEETRAGFLQPWFENWTFPSLNPACSIAGLAESLGLSTSTMLDRTANLFSDRASIDEAQTADFYTLLPYVEYSLGTSLPDGYPHAIAANVTRTAEADGYEDADHFFTHALGGSSDITSRIPDEQFALYTDQLLDAQQGDGGWPTPYDPAWRPWTTASAMITLARLRA